MPATKGQTAQDQAGSVTASPPTDTLLLVLAYLGPGDVVRAGLVNRYWGAVALSKEAWAWRVHSILSEKHCQPFEDSYRWPSLWCMLQAANLLLPLDCHQRQSPGPGFHLCSAPLKAWAPPVNERITGLLTTLTRGLRHALHVQPQGTPEHTEKGSAPVGWVSPHAAWLRERPPVGAPPIDPFLRPLPGFASKPEEGLITLASTCQLCSTYQVVDLVRELMNRGLTQQQACAFLDSAPPLSLQVWLASRFDCEGKGRATLALCPRLGSVPTVQAWSCNTASRAQGQLQLGDPDSWQVPEGSREHDALDAQAWGNDVAHNPLLHTLQQRFMLELGPDEAAMWTSGIVRPPLGGWQAVQGCLSGYTPGKRWAIVTLRGSDVPVWAGYYGCKFAGPQLTFGSLETFAAQKQD